MVACSTTTAIVAGWITMLLVRSGSSFSASSARRRMHRTINVSTRTAGATTERTRLFSSAAAAAEESRPPPPPLIVGGKEIRYAMAPMVAASDYPFRKLVRKYSLPQNESVLCYTQMLHAKNVVGNVAFRRNHFDFTDNIKDDLLQSQIKALEGWKDSSVTPYLGQEHDEGGPLMVQLAGSDPVMVVDAARRILEEPGSKVNGFDLNCGCPQGIARKGGYGAFLMEQDDDLVCNILKQLRLSLPDHIKVSAKIRLPVEGTDAALKERITKLVDSSGIDFLTIHGRTLKENKGLVGGCHFDKIALAIQTAQAIRPDFPVVANGGIENHGSLASVLAQTGASAVMSSEALLETPSLFAAALASETIDSDKHPEAAARALWDQQRSFARDYLNICAQHPPLPGVLSNSHGPTNVVRGHMFKFLHRFLQDMPDLRLVLADQDQSNTLQQMMDILEAIENRYDSSEEGALLLTKCTQRYASWYRRHWDMQKNKTMHSRTAGRGKKEEPVVIPLEERKRQMQERIQRLRAQKEERSQKRYVA